MNKFEQLMEYVINDEETKARELFHEIVVEKSRQIYEEMMEAEEEESIGEAKDKEEESVEEAREEEEESIGEAKDKEEESMEEAREEEEESLEETMMGGDQADDLIDDVESEEQGMNMEGEGDDDSDLENRVVDLEDKLDELMAEFEALMGDEDVDMDDAEMDMDDAEMDMDADDDMTDLEMDDDELETEGMMENVVLKSAPAPVKSEEGGINKKAVVAANSGARGAMAKPVHTGANEGGHHDTAAYKNTTKDLVGKVANTPAQSTQKLSPATKPHLGQASGVNVKSPLPGQ